MRFFKNALSTLKEWPIGEVLAAIAVVGGAVAILGFLVFFVGILLGWWL